MKILVAIFCIVLSIGASAESKLDVLREAYNDSHEVPILEDFVSYKDCFLTSLDDPDLLENVRMKVVEKTINNGPKFPPTKYKELRFYVYSYSEKYGQRNIIYTEKDMVLVGSYIYPTFFIRRGEDGYLYINANNGNGGNLPDRAGYCFK